MRGGAPPLRVFLVATIGIALFSYMDALMKDLVIVVGLYTTLFWRTLASCVVSGALYVGAPAVSPRFGPRPRRPTGAALRVHVLRGTVSTVMAMLFFWGLARIPMAQAVALTFIAPLLSLYLAAALLGEHVTRRTVVASCVALVGVLVIVAGQWRSGAPDAATPGTVAVLLSALCYAFNIVLMRKQALVAGPLEVAFSQSVVVGVLLAAGAPFFAGVPDSAQWPPLLTASVLAVVSLMLLAWAYARGEANTLSATEYTAFVWASVFGWIVFGERLSTGTVAGAALIVAGCLYGARQGGAVVASPEVQP